MTALGLRWMSQTNAVIPWVEKVSPTYARERIQLRQTSSTKFPFITPTASPTRKMSKQKPTNLRS
eukprot:scaffold7277_cov80-Skeletonema_menzelii.AAC.6